MTEKKLYPFSDDLMFSTVFGNHPDPAKELLETMLQERIGKLTVLSAQKTLNYETDRKFVRMDMYLETDRRIYDVEMESFRKRRAKAELVRRAACYAACAMTDSAERGDDYLEMKIHQPVPVYETQRFRLF